MYTTHTHTHTPKSEAPLPRHAEVEGPTMPSSAPSNVQGSTANRVTTTLSFFSFFGLRASPPRSKTITNAMFLMAELQAGLM